LIVKLLWDTGAPPSPPPDDGVAVWLAAPRPELEVAVEPWLSEPERARRDAFLHAGARGQFLTGRWLLRGVVGPLSGVAPAALVVRESERGALAVASDGGWYVNLSHTDGLVALAVSATPVGVDVEDRHRVGRTVELADRFFAPSEARALRALPADRQRDRFFDLWTLKEAYIKARGLGLAIPLASFAFDLDAPTLGFGTETEPDAARWQFARLDPTPRHRLAVCRARARP